MKNSTILLLLFLVVFCSCAKQNCNNDSNISLSYNDIEYIEDDSIYSSDHDEYMEKSSFNKICIPDKETAINTAISIFEGINKNDPQYENYKVFLVEYDTDDKIWVVCFGKEDTLGGGYYIALKQENSEVIRMWNDE